MLRRDPGLLPLSLLLALLAACAPMAAPTLSAPQRATRLAITAAAVLTATAAAQPPRAPTASATTPATASPSSTQPPTDHAPRTTSTAPSRSTPAGRTTSTPSPTPCTNDSAFVTDVSIPDGTHFAPGAGFVKTWRLRNDGVCTWTSAYTFRPVSGDVLAGASLNLPAEVPAGGTVDLSVPLTAPSANGTYRGEWQLHTPEGEPFGTKPYVEIVVP